MNNDLFLKFGEDDQDIDSEVGYDLRVDLGNDTEQWINEILTEVYNKNPYLGNYLAEPVFEKFDPNMQAAIGHIVARGPSGTVIQIPIIVKDGKLSPVDLFIYKGKPYPLTKSRIDDLFFSPDIGTSLVANQMNSVSRLQGYGLTGSVTAYPRHDTFGKFGSLMDIVDRCPKDEKVKLAHYINDNQAIMEKLGNDMCKDVLGRIFKHIDPIIDDTSKIASYQISRMSPGKYQFREWDNGTINISTHAGKAALEHIEKLGADASVLDSADSDGVFTVPVDEKNVVFSGDIKANAIEISEDGPYSIWMPTLEAKQAFVLNTVKSLDGGKLDYKIAFLEDRSGYGYQSKIVGVFNKVGPLEYNSRRESSGYAPITCGPDSYDSKSGYSYDFRRVTSHAPAEDCFCSYGYGAKPDEHYQADKTGPSLFGRMICIVCEEDVPDGEEPGGYPRTKRVRTAYEPILVKGGVKIKGSNGIEYIHGIVGGKTVSIVFSKNIRQPVKIDPLAVSGEIRMAIKRGSDAYAVPVSALVIDLHAHQLKFIDSVAQITALSKEAAEDQLGATQIEYSNGRYSFYGDWPSKLESEHTKVADRDVAHLVLAAGGCSNKVANHILDEAEKSRKAVCYGLGYVDLQKEASKKPLDMSGVVDIVKDRKNQAKRIKVAAVLPGAYSQFANPSASEYQVPTQGVSDPQIQGALTEGNVSEAVEGVLSLGFLNRDNVQYFVAQVPKLESVITVLAQMLLSIRIRPSLALMEDSLVREALNHIEDVTQRLKGVPD